MQTRVDVLAEPAPIDFELATDFLSQAREAHELGDLQRFHSLRYLLLLTLGLGSDAHR